MHVATSTTISAPIDSVWAILADVEHWSDWTASIRSVQPLEAGPIGAGSRFRVRQPQTPTAIWEVTDFAPGRSFTWSTGRPGVRIVAGHQLRRSGSGTRADLTLDITGRLAWLVGALSGRRIRRMVQLETDGLRHAAQRPQPDHQPTDTR